MKRRPKKLALNRETVRTLQPPEMAAAEEAFGRPAGGTGTGNTVTCQNSCCCNPPQSETFEILSGCASNCGW